MIELEVHPAHNQTLCIIGGGPSAADTLPDRTGKIVTVNAGHDWLIDQGVIPWACGFLDPNQRIAEMFTPRNDVLYFVAHTVHTDVMRKLEGFKVVFWYPAPTAPKNKLQIGGGSSMGLRWLNLGAVMGFRRFDIHGLDSSFRKTATHAYNDYRDESFDSDIWINGYRTRPNFLAQCIDFFEMINGWNFANGDECEIHMHGEGLLQSRWKTGNGQFTREQHAIADQKRRRL